MARRMKVHICRECGFESKTENRMKTHFAKTHNKKGRRNNRKVKQ